MSLETVDGTIAAEAALEDEKSTSVESALASGELEPVVATLPTEETSEVDTEEDESDEEDEDENEEENGDDDDDDDEEEENEEDEE